MDKKQTLIYMTEKQRKDLKILGGITSGFNILYDFFLENKDLYIEQLKSKELLEVPIAAEIGNEYTCSGCDKKNPVSDCLMVKWDNTGGTTVGICTPCRDLMRENKVSEVVKLVKILDRNRKKR